VSTRLLWAVLVCSFLLKAALLVPAHNVLPITDSFDYVLYGRTLNVAGELGSERPPLYPALLAGVFAAASWVGIPPPTGGNPGVGGGLVDLDLAKFVQVVLSTLSVWLVYVLGATLFDSRSGLTAAALFAFYPDFVGFSHLLWSETLFVTLFVAAVVLLFRGVRSGRVVTLGGAGVCIGLAALTREIGLTLLPWILVWIVLIGAATRRQGLRAALVVMLAAVVTIAPWTVRNALKHHAFVPVTAIHGVALLWGASPDVVGDLRRVRQQHGPQTDAAARRRAVEIIRSDPAGWLRRCLLRNLPGLWSLGYDGVIAHLGHPAGYGPMPAAWARAVIVIIVASYVAVAVCAITGMALAADWRPTVLFVGFVGIYCVMHAIASGWPRHRLPLMAFACVYAGHLVCRRGAELRGAARPLRVGIAMAGLLVFSITVAAANHRPLLRAWERVGTAAEVVH
jgi:4-amino-4-deoxy-L-arabinose transferase-like glycosyltransferase